MSSSYEQAFDKFDALLSTWKGAYVCAMHSYVGTKTPEGPRLLYGRVLLEPSGFGINETTFQYETMHILAGRFVRAITSDDVAAVIAKARSGEMDELAISIPLTVETAGSFSAYFAPIYHPFLAVGPRLPSLLIRGISRHNLLVAAADSREIDWELRAADIPFDTLDELLGHCGLPALAQIGDSTTLEIVARAPAAIGEGSTINGTEAIIECRMASALDPSKLRLGYRIFKKDQQVDRGSMTCNACQWREEKGIKIGSVRVSVGEAPFMQAFLSYDRVALHQWWITDPTKRLNPRHAVHQLFDQESDLLQQMLLKPETDKPYGFEGAVSTLLNLLGFSIANYGRIPKLQQGPDIIAFTPLGHVAIIECTMGLLDQSDKLAKLVQRTNRIKDKLAQAGYGQLQLLPVIVTPLSRSEVAADLHIASQHGIAVVCKEEIEGALNRVGLPTNADKTFEDAKRLIPGSEQTSLFKE